MASSVIETPYAEWVSEGNTFEDPVESLARYTEHLRKLYVDAGEYNEDVEVQLSRGLLGVLQGNNLLTEENQEEVQKKIYASYNPSLDDDVLLLQKGGNLSSSDVADVSAYLDNRFNDTPLPASFDMNVFKERVRSLREDYIKESFRNGDITIGAYVDQTGKRRLVSGTLSPDQYGLSPEERELEEIKNADPLLGVRAGDLFNLRESRVVDEDTGLMKWELEERYEVFDFLETAAKNDPFLKARVLAEARFQGMSQSWDDGDYMWDTAGEWLGYIGSGAKSIWGSLFKDQAYRDEVNENDEFKIAYRRLTEDAAANREALIGIVQRETGVDRDIAADAVEDLGTKISVIGSQEDGIAPTFKLTDDIDRMSNNVVRTNFSGTLVHDKLLLKPKEFNIALDDANVSIEERKKLEANRAKAVANNYAIYDEVLSSDEDIQGRWAKAKLAGVEAGLSDSEVLEKFIEEDNPNIRTEGIADSVYNSVAELVYGASALVFDSDWGNEGLREINKKREHIHKLGHMFGYKMGVGYQALEAATPLIVDALITRGLSTFTTKATGAMMAGGKTLALGRGGWYAGANAMRAVLQGGLTRNLAIKAGGTVDEVVDGLITGNKYKNLSNKQVFDIVNDFNSATAKRLGFAGATFLSAANRSSVSAYGNIHRAVTEVKTAELTEKYTSADGTWEDGWSKERVAAEVKELARTAALDGAITNGISTGLITATIGHAFGGKFAGAEQMFMRGLSLRQIKNASEKISGVLMSDATFKKMIQAAAKKELIDAGFAGVGRVAMASVGEGFEEWLDAWTSVLIQDAFADRNTPFKDVWDAGIQGGAVGMLLGAGAPTARSFATNIAPEYFEDAAASFAVQSRVLNRFAEGVANDPELRERANNLLNLAPQVAQEVQNITEAAQATPPVEPTEEQDKKNADATAEAAAETTGAETQVDPELDRMDRLKNLILQFEEGGRTPEQAALLDEEREAATTELNYKIKELQDSGVWETMTPEEQQTYETTELEKIVLDKIKSDSKLVNEFKSAFEKNATPEVIKAAVEAESTQNESKPVTAEVADNPAVNKLPTDQQVNIASPNIEANPNLTPDEKERMELAVILSKENLYQKYEADIAKEANPSKKAKLQKQFEKAKRNGKVYSPEVADSERQIVYDKAKKRIEDEAKRDAPAVEYKGDILFDIERLVEAGYPISIDKNHIAELGLELLDNTREARAELAKEVRKRIKEKFPTIKVSSKGKNGKPRGVVVTTLSQNEKVVYIEDGAGVFNNDPEGMLGLMMQNIPIRVDPEMVGKDTTNPAFVIEKVNDVYYVTDIMVPVMGGKVSAVKARQEKTKVLPIRPDHTRVKDLTRRLKTLQNVEVKPEHKVKNPFQVDGRSSNWISLPNLLLEVSDVKLLQGIIESSTSELSPAYNKAAATSLSLSLQEKIRMYSEQVNRGKVSSDVVFDFEKIKNDTVKYYSRVKKARTKQAQNDWYSLFHKDITLENEPTVKDAEEGARDTFTPPNPNAINPLSQDTLQTFIEGLHGDVRAALELDPALKDEVVFLVDMEANRGQEIASEYTLEKLTTEFLNLFASGERRTKDRLASFENDLNETSKFPMGKEVVNTLQSLGISKFNGDITKNKALYDLMKDHLLKLVGPNETIVRSDVLDFYNHISQATHGLKHRATQTDKAAEVIARENMAEAMQLGLRGGDPQSVIEALEKIAEGGPKYLRYIAKVLLNNKDVILSTRFHLGNSPAKDVAGEFYFAADGTKVVNLNLAKSGGRGLAQTLIHEYIHAFTAEALLLDPALRTPAQQEAIEFLERVMVEARKKTSYAKWVQMQEGTSNVAEFIAYIFTDPVFQGAIQQIKVPNSKQNLLQKIFKAITRLWRGPQQPEFQSAFEAAMTLTGLKTQATPTKDYFVARVAGDIHRSQVEAKELADLLNQTLSSTTEDATAENLQEFAEKYVPNGVGVTISRTSDKAVMVDKKSGEIVFNPYKAQEVINDLSLQQTDEVRAQQILAAMFNREMAIYTAENSLTDKQLDSIVENQTDEELQYLIESVYTEDIAKKAKEELNDPKLDRPTILRQIVKDVLSTHAYNALDSTTNAQQMAFLKNNPQTLEVKESYLKKMLGQLTFFKDKQQVGPEMRNAINNVISEIRAVRNGYSYAPSVAEDAVDIFIKQITDAKYIFEKKGEPSAPTIESEKNENAIPEYFDDAFSNWINHLYVDVTSVTNYDIETVDPENRKAIGWRNAKKWVTRRADRRVVEAFQKHEKFNKEANLIVRTLYNNFNTVRKRVEANLSAQAGVPVTIPNELISKATGSTVGTTLSSEQQANIEGAYTAALNKAKRFSGEKRKMMETLALEDKKKAEIEVREQNRDRLIREKNEALEEILRLSPELYNIITVGFRSTLDTLSKAGMKVFEDYMSPEDLNIHFNSNDGIYLTRKYRMFEDHNFVDQMLDENDTEYEAAREAGMYYFAQEYYNQKLEEKMQSRGLSKQDAKYALDSELSEDQLNSEGKRMMRAFIRSYSSSRAEGKIKITNTPEGQKVEVQDLAKSKANDSFKRVMQKINEKQDLPKVIRDLLGEYTESEGINNIARSINHVAGIMSSQKFFNTLKQLGTQASDPWMVDTATYSANPEAYKGWVELISTTDDMAPLKGMYVPEVIAGDLKDMVKYSSQGMAQLMDLHTASNNPIAKGAEKAAVYLTGASMVSKTLGSPSFYERVAIGNVFGFGPMQGYLGGITDSFKELKTLAGMAIGSKSKKDSFIARSFQSRGQALDPELSDARTMGLFGDEVEVELIKELLRKNDSHESIANDASAVAQAVHFLKGVESKVIDKLPEPIADVLKKYNIKPTSTKDAIKELVRLGGGLASALDGMFKIGMFKFELDYLVRAGKADLKANKVSEYTKMLDQDGNPTQEMRDKAASIVKDTAQSYSRTLPIVDYLSQKKYTLFLAAFIRFATDIIRVRVNTFRVIKRELKSENPVIKNRGRRRLIGMVTYTMASQGAAPTALSYLFRGGWGEDEEKALRAGEPYWMEYAMPVHLRLDDREFVSLDPTYMNPFSATDTPVTLALIDLITEQDPVKAIKTLVQGELKPFVSDQILAGAIAKAFISDEDEYGRTLIAESDENLNDLAKRIAFVYEKAFEPRLLTNTRRAIKSFEAIADGDGSEQFLDSPIGYLLREVIPLTPNFDTLEKKMERAFKMNASKFNGAASKLRSRITNPKGIPDEDLYQLYDDASKERLFQGRQLTSYINGFRALGATDAQIFNAMKQVGISKQRSERALTGNGYTERYMLTKPVLDGLMENDLGSRARKIIDYATSNYEQWQAH